MSNPRKKSPPAPDQRRQYPRIPLRMSAEIHLGDRSFTAMTRDLSEGGCGLELKELLVEDTQVTLGLFLVVDDVEEERVPPLWVKARVVWAAEMEAVSNGGLARSMAGVRFEVITDQQKVWVRQVLAHLAPIVAD